MDGTPYPPPAPEVPPPPAPAVPQPPTPGVPQPQYAPTPPPKRKTGLIIAIVVGVLLLCCCGTGAAGFIAFRAAEDTATETIDEISNEFEPDVLDSESGPALDTGWEDFAPPAYDPSVFVALEPFHEEVLAEAAAMLFPDFELIEAVVKPSAEYTTDLVLARASLASDPGAEIAFYLEVENTAAFDAGWTNDPSAQEFDYLDVTTASNGREYFWDNTQMIPLLGGIADPAVEDLLTQVSYDFPGCVVYLVETEGSSAFVEFTRWESYPDYSTGYTADYTLDGDTWVLDSAGQW